MSRKKTTMEVNVVSDYWNVKEAAAYMKVAYGTVYNMISKKDENKLPVRYQGRKPVFLIEELKKWMLQRTKLV